MHNLYCRTCTLQAPVAWKESFCGLIESGTRGEVLLLSDWGDACSLFDVVFFHEAVPTRCPSCASSRCREQYKKQYVCLVPNCSLMSKRPELAIKEHHICKIFLAQCGCQ